MKQTYSLLLKISALFICAFVSGILFSNNASAQTAPVNPPTGGFAIDGNLQANSPVTGIGDWIPGSAGSGGNVLTSAGVPINPARTYHIIDPYNGGDDI